LLPWAVTPVFPFGAVASTEVGSAVDFALPSGLAFTAGGNLGVAARALAIGVDHAAPLR
jgi:hypothetical protein